MSTQDRWRNEGRIAGNTERLTGICTGNPYPRESMAAKDWWYGYNCGLAGRLAD